MTDKRTAVAAGQPSARMRRMRLCAAMACASIAGAAPAFAAGWEPTKPVEFIVPAGTGGGADQMARLLQGVITKNNLMKQPMIVVNKSGGAGAEGFLAMKEAKGDPNKIVITLSNVFTTPLATGVPFSWKDLTPVAMLALDQFVLWVNADTPYKTAKEYLDAVKAGGPEQVQDGGHRLEAGRPDHHRRHRKGGSGRQVHLRSVQGRRRRGRAARRQAHRLDGEQPDRSGGAVARRTAAPAVRVRRRAHAVQGEGHCDDVVERHPELQGGRRSGRLHDAARHLHAPRRDQGTGRLTTSISSRRFAKPPDWKKFMEDGAFNTTFMFGLDYAKWVEKADNSHHELMREAGFLAKP